MQTDRAPSSYMLQELQNCHWDSPKQNHLVLTFLLTLDKAYWKCTSDRITKVEKRFAEGELSRAGIHCATETTHLIHLIRGVLVTLPSLHANFRPRGPAESLSLHFVGN